MYPINLRTREVRTSGKTTSLVIPSGGIIHDLDIESLLLTKTQTPLTISTTAPVEIRNFRMRTSGTGLFDISGQPRNLKLTNGVVQNTTPVGSEFYGRAIDIYRYASFEASKVDFVDHGGVKMAMAGQAGGVFILTECRSLNVQSCMGDGNGALKVPSPGDTNNNAVTGPPSWHQAVQLTGFNAPVKVAITWMEIVNQWGNSMPGDSISVIDCVGQAGNPILIADCLVDGGYAMYQYSIADANGSFLAYQPAPLGNRLTYSGTGMMIEGATSGYINRLRNFLIACGNGGLSMYNAAAGTCLNDENIIVSSGLAPDGTPLMGARGPGMYRNAPSGSWNNNYVRHSRLVYSGAYNTTTREDHAGALGSMAGTVPGDTGVAVTLADEQAQRVAWLAKKRKNGIYPGSTWLEGLGGY